VYLHLDQAAKPEIDKPRYSDPKSNSNNESLRQAVCNYIAEPNHGTFFLFTILFNFSYFTFLPALTNQRSKEEIV
jgi:hypothetical protein